MNGVEPGHSRREEIILLVQVRVEVRVEDVGGAAVGTDDERGEMVLDGRVQR